MNIVQSIFSSIILKNSKGGSIKVAILQISGEYCIIQDADLELNPFEINDLLIPVIKIKQI